MKARYRLDIKSNTEAYAYKYFEWLGDAIDAENVAKSLGLNVKMEVLLNGEWA